MYKAKWVALGYTVPVDPSRNRVYVWRALRKMGVQNFKSTMAILPNTPNNRKQFTTLAEKIQEMKGEAWLMEMNFMLQKDNEEMEGRFYAAAEQRFHELREEIGHFLAMLREEQNPESEVMVNELKKIQKDYQKHQKEPDNPVYDQVESAMGELRQAIMGMRHEFGTLRGIWGKIMGYNE